MLEMMTSNFIKKIFEPGLEIDPNIFQKLLASDGAASDQFGISVAVSSDGSTIVAGARADDDKGSASGSAYIFTKQAIGNYLQTHKLVASDGAAGDYFGGSVAISDTGSTIIVAAYQDDDKGANSGSVYVFTKQTDGSYLETQKLIASDGAAGDNFGRTVGVSKDGNTLVVGAFYDDDKGLNSGSVYIFTKQVNGSYLQTHKLVPSDGAANDQFGWSVAISEDGSTIIVGAYWDDDKGVNSGSVYVFIKQTDGNYLQTQKLIASDGADDDWFGISVGISGDGSRIIVGAHGDDDQGTNSGSIYVFSKQANNSYLQTQKLVASDGSVDDGFGWSVAVSEDSSMIIVGAYADDDKGSNSGSVYIYTKQADGSYLQTQKLVPSDGAANDLFGYSVAISQTSVVVGACVHLTKGAVYVY